METTVEEKIRLEHYHGAVCPYCHARAVPAHESNGFEGWRASYLCGDCREQWDAECYTRPSAGVDKD